MNVQPFSGAAQGTVTIAATATNSSTTLASTAPNQSVARVVNAGASVIFLVFGTGAQTASVTTSLAMLPGTVEVFGKPIGADNVGVICNSGLTSTVYVTCGEGQ